MLPVLVAIELTVDNLLYVLMSEKLEDKRDVIRVQKKLCQVLKLEHI